MERLATTRKFSGRKGVSRC